MKSCGRTKLFKDQKIVAVSATVIQIAKYICMKYTKI